MKNILLKMITTIIMFSLFVVILTPDSLARYDYMDPGGGGGTTGQITPDQIKGDTDTSLGELDFLDDITEGIRVIGIFIAVGALMIIGIKYMTGSIEEKANYKKSMMPYIIGCVILFGASAIAPQIKEIIGEEADTESIGNLVLGIIQIVGTMVSIGALMILGIKYMLGSVEERASYKKSMLPYVAGFIILFAAVNIASGISDFVNAIIPAESEAGDHTADFSERACPNCGKSVVPTFDIDKHTYVCPKCGTPM